MRNEDAIVKYYEYTQGYHVVHKGVILTHAGMTLMNAKIKCDEINSMGYKKVKKLKKVKDPK